MADAKPSYQWPHDASEASKSCSQPDELELLHQETKRLRELVVELSKMAIKNAVNAK
jgi:catabolite regulation protein CreA